MSRYYAIGDHVFLAADVEQAGTSAHAHPVVVIDPEAASDAELAPLLSIGTVENARDVLRAMLNPTPPKPEEPTGLGAVVEDAEGTRWVLYTHPHSTAPWVGNCVSVEWDDIAAVRVLSEGVTA